MITQISPMEFKEPHHCHDDNGTGIDFYGYMNAEGNLTDSLFNSVRHIAKGNRIAERLSLIIKTHRTNANAIALQMTRQIHWYINKQNEKRIKKD